MANNQSQQPNIEQARELLSPYLDGEVSTAERVLVEEAIATSPELRRELETLRQTVSLLHTLPPMPAPRPFTLAEADVQPARPTPRRGLAFPTWLKSWGMLAATLLCVLAIGGVFLGQQFGGLLAPAEIAFRQESAAPQAAMTEAEAEQTAPVEQAAEEAPAAEAAVAEEAPAELAAEKEEAASDDLAAAEKVEIQPETEMADDEATEEMRMLAGEPEVAEEAEAEVESKAAADGAAPESDGDAIERGAVMATASPLPTAAALAAPTAPIVEPAQPAEAPAAPPPPAPAEGAPAGGGGETESSLGQNALAPRSVEIQNLRLQISPGAIQLGGRLEAKPGTPLVANLQRNGEPFDSWADPATLQTAVQPEGQFSFTIRANTGRPDRDLFASEPAGYQITITALDPADPVIAAANFDTFGPPAATEPPPPTFTPRPTPTVVAPVAEIPSSPPPPTTAPTSTPGAVQTVPSRSTTLIIVVGLLVVGGLVILGLVVWLFIRKQQR